MKTMFTVFAAVSAIALVTATAGYAASPENKTTYEAKDNGGYKVKSKSKATTSTGTEKAGERTVDVNVKDDGSTSKTTTTKSEADPKGMMNAKEDEAKTTTEMNADGTAKVEKSESHEDAAGTSTSTEAETKTDAKGNVTTTTKKTVDPKGLMNKKTIKSKTVNGQPVSE